MVKEIRGLSLLKRIIFKLFIQSCELLLFFLGYFLRGQLLLIFIVLTMTNSQEHFLEGSDANTV